MRINFDQELKDWAGEPMREQSFVQLVEEASGQIRRELVQGKTLTLKSVCLAAINNRIPNEQITGEELFSRFMLGQRIFSSNGEGVDLTTEEAALIKSLLVKTAFTPLMVGRAFQIIEGTNKNETNLNVGNNAGVRRNGQRAKSN